MEKSNEELRQRYKERIRCLVQELECKYPDPDISQVTWNDENLQTYRNELQEKAPQEKDRLWELGHKLFYVNPVGTYRQNEELVGLVVNYTMNNVKEDVLLQRLFAYEHPIFRVYCMAEVRPRTGEFRPIKYDLVEQIIKRKDASLLRKLYDYINLSDYAEYSLEINELLNMSPAL